MPDFIVCRSHQPLDDVRKKKIEVFAHINSDHIIAAPDVTSVYEIPLKLENQQLGKKLLAHLDLDAKQQPQWDAWQQRVHAIINPQRQVQIAIVGKYLNTGNFGLTDSYLSIYHALMHAGAEHNIGVEIKWFNAKDFVNDQYAAEHLPQFDGIIIPGGFGTSGIDGKMNAISYVRTNNIPYLGLCYGLQLAVIEFARNVCDLKNAHTTEIDPDTPHPVITLLPTQKDFLKENNYGGTMRLGAYSATIKPNTQIAQLYSSQTVMERHRHRYEVNPDYIDQLSNQGLVFSGSHERDDGTRLMEFIELPTHPFFIATQAHPEFKSRFGRPNPLFYGFVAASYEHALMRSFDTFLLRKNTQDERGREKQS